jgi:hypothetical protein
MRRLLVFYDIPRRQLHDPVSLQRAPESDETAEMFGMLLGSDTSCRPPRIYGAIDALLRLHCHLDSAGARGAKVIVGVINPSQQRVLRSAVSCFNPIQLRVLRRKPFHALNPRDRVPRDRTPGQT